MTNDELLSRLAYIARSADGADGFEVGMLVQNIHDNFRRAEADRDSQQRTAVKAMEAHKLIGLPASVGVCEPIEGFAERPQDIVPAVRDMALRIKDLETERDEWKAQAEGEAIVAGSYRDERDALASEARYHQQEIDGIIDRLRYTQFERDTLAAHVERLREGLHQALIHWGANVTEEDGAAYAECEKRCEEVPGTSLARIKAQWQAEALEVAAEDDWSDTDMLLRAAELRRQAGGEK